MQTYDGAVIQAFASKLYASAAWGLFLYPLFLGGAAGVSGGAFYGRGVGLAGLVAGALFGYYVASQRAFRLRLLAQTALCQVQIEENTRRSRASQTSLNARTEPTLEAGTPYATPEVVSPNEDTSVKGCVARLTAVGCQVTRAAHGGWEATAPSGAASVANSLEELRALAANPSSGVGTRVA